MTRYPPGVYTILNRGGIPDQLEYYLDNQRYTVMGDSMVTVVAHIKLNIPTTGDIPLVTKIANHPNQIKGAGQYAL